MYKMYDKLPPLVGTGRTDLGQIVATLMCRMECNFFSKSRFIGEVFTKLSSPFSPPIVNSAFPPAPDFLLAALTSSDCDNFYHFFLMPMYQKILGRGLPLPPHLQIDPIYTVCEKWTKSLGSAPPPIIWTKIQKSSYFFRETFPYPRIW